jgi:hypothetical protein
MAFGGIFGCWLLFTVILTYKNGWICIVYSTAGYVIALVFVAIADWLLSRNNEC